MGVGPADADAASSPASSSRSSVASAADDVEKPAPDPGALGSTRPPLSSSTTPVATTAVVVPVEAATAGEASSPAESMAMAATLAVPVAVVRRDRSNLVTSPFLMASGAIGIFLAIVLALVLSAVRLQPITGAAVRTIDSARQSATDAADAVDRAGAASLGGSDVARQLADASLDAAAALDVEIFSVRPLARAAEPFRQVAGGAQALADQLDQAGTAAIAASEDLDGMALEIERLAEETGRFADEKPLAGPLGTLLGIGLFGWLVLQSLGDARPGDQPPSLIRCRGGGVGRVLTRACERSGRHSGSSAVPATPG